MKDPANKRDTVSCLLKTHCVNNLFWGLRGGCVIMKEMQCSEAESTANHPAFSAPGSSIFAFKSALAFKNLLSNRLSPSNVCFQIGCQPLVWFWFGLVGFSFNASLEPQPRARRRARLAEDAPARHAFWTGRARPNVLFSCFYWVVMGDGPAQRGTNRGLSTCPNA